MAMTWTSDLATGIEEIDSQHKELFRRINNLLDACSRGRGKGEVGEVLRFLEDYIVSHFAAEERYMQEYLYSGTTSHMKEHREFMNKFFHLKELFETDGPGVHIVISTNHIIVDWLRTHIRKLDKALAVFLKERFTKATTI